MISTLFAKRDIYIYLTIINNEQTIKIKFKLQMDKTKIINGLCVV